jgi:muramoyltetrapeptide carboxypeptidase
MKNGIAYLKDRGFMIKCGSNLGKQYGYFAGTDEERISDLHTMIADADIDAIICARGGWGGLRLINKIDYSLIRKNPKPIIGYSDITTLQLAIWAKTKIPSFSGPMVGVEMGKGIESFTADHFWGQLTNTKSKYRFDFSESETAIMRGGKATGFLVGGCLSQVTTLLGTPYCPNFNNAIMFIEDVGEKPYKIDRYLAHLFQAGVFNVISGLILGEFLDCEPEENENSFTLPEIFEHYFSKARYPVLRNFPYGHGDIKFTLPIGVRCQLHAEKGKMTLENPFFS